MIASCKDQVNTNFVARGAAEVSDRSGSASVTTDEANAVLAASRVLVALSAESIGTVEDVVDLTQFRALVVMASSTSVSLGELADACRIHLSSASRLCDKLVAKGLVSRAEAPADRRVLTLTLAPDGRRLVQRVMRRRRQDVIRILGKLAPDHRAELVRAFRDFAEAGGETPDQDLWAIGWTT
jgi:DNA-binding MarR family transcriptional regulator